MKPITLQDLMTATGGMLIGGLRNPDTVITGAQSDNRKIAPGDVFYAFPGERVDGHRFVKAALEAGAVGAVVTKVPEDYVPGRFYLLVDDAVAAFGDLARWYRAQFHIPVIGITGSVGKTTTKDMTSAVLSQSFRTAATAGNFNNNIGLPRTVLTIEEDTGAAVIEMGMNHPGEIAYLTRIAQPTAAVITNVGEAHIGNLGSRENIFRAKSEIFEGLKDGGFAVLNGDDEYLVRLRGNPAIRERFRLIYVGEGEECDWRAADIDDTLAEALRFTAVTPIGTFPVTVPAIGRHMIYPALTAAAVGAQLGLSIRGIQAGIAAYVPTKMRMEIRHLPSDVVIYNDTYNANPQSMKAGLLALSKAAAGRRIAVVGDMFELGEMEEELHREVGAFAAGLGLDALIAVGAASSFLAEEAAKCGMRDVRRCADKEAAKAEVSSLAGPDTAWLFKASRGMALEDLVQYLETRTECG